MKNIELENYIKELQSIEDKKLSFIDYLYKLMDKYHFDKASDLYNKADISRQLWSAFISGKSIPSKNNVLKIVFALHASNHECKYLMKKAGYTLPSSSKFSLIIRYFLENKNYDLIELNETLMEYGYKDSLIY